jgi:hypothetical protein
MFAMQIDGALVVQSPAINRTKVAVFNGNGFRRVQN